MKGILDNSIQQDTLRNLEYIIEKKEAQRPLTDFERFLYGFAYQKIISSELTNSSVVPVMSMSVAFLALVLYRDRNKSLLKKGLKSLMALQPIISIAVDDLKNGKYPFYSVKNPLLKVGAFLLTGIVTVPMYIAYKTISKDKMNKLFVNVGKLKNRCINKILSKISGQDIDYERIYNEVKQEISQLKEINKEEILRASQQQPVEFQNECELVQKLDKPLQTNKEKSKETLTRINVNCTKLSPKKQDIEYTMG